MKEALEKFGTVEECEEKDGMLHVKITKGFHRGASNTFDLMDKVIKLSGNKYPIVHRFVTDNNLFHLILKPTK